MSYDGFSSYKNDISRFENVKFWLKAQGKLQGRDWCDSCVGYDFRASEQAHQSETELLRKRVQNLREELKNIVMPLSKDSPCLMCKKQSGYLCLECSIEEECRKALAADDKASEGGV